MSQNPFEYEAASNLSPDDVLAFYTEDFNYSRFVRSKRNIILVGERGTGKSMALRFNSLAVSQRKAIREKVGLDLGVVCVYVPCQTPLLRRPDAQLLTEFLADVISEHYLVLSIMHAVVKDLREVAGLLDGVDSSLLQKELEIVWEAKLPSGNTVLDSLDLFFQQQAAKSQKAMNARQPDAYYEDAWSFSSGIIPLLNVLRKIPRLANSHFVFMIDDAHWLNEQQMRAICSWLSYRDNSIFSFKVAMAKADQPALVTRNGGGILDGHDYIQVDMEQPYQNKDSDFAQFARSIVARRLDKIGLKIAPEDFFPEHPAVAKEVEGYKVTLRQHAESEHPDWKQKQITDYVYRHARANYFKNRQPKANLPIYAGFDTLVHVSTGVIRNLLEPCYWMYDKVVSELNAAGAKTSKVENIPPAIQSQVLIERSRRKWEWMRDQLGKGYEECTEEEGRRIYKLFDNLAILFKKRLSEHASEPRAITFTISEVDSAEYQHLKKLLQIARKAQLLYSYTSSAKDSGKREEYFVPNRILCPERGLDPHGQHARVSIKASHLWDAAQNNREIPFAPAAEKSQAELGFNYDSN